MEKRTAQKEEVYAVIDLKSFYASCECAARGLDIFSTPLVVADISRTENSIVMSATPYLKTKYRIPNVCRIRDLPKVPKMIFATPRMAYYIEISAKVVSIFLDFVDEEDLHVYSIDESFLQLTPYLEMYGCDAETIVARIQKKIYDELGLVATSGMGPNMFLAKVCLDNDGKKTAPYRGHWHQNDFKEKLWAVHPITEIWGISTGISSHLSRMGIRSLEALARANIKILEKEFGVMGYQLHNLANGIDSADIRKKYVPKEKNLSVGQTLTKDYTMQSAKLILREMNDDLCFRLRMANKKTSCVSLFVGYSAKVGGGFSRQCTIDVPTDDNESLYEAIMGLYDRFVMNLPIRNLGISFSRLEDYNGQQYTLFEDGEEVEERHSLYKSLDNIHFLFGENSALRATSLLEDSTIRLRHEEIGGHKA